MKQHLAVNFWKAIDKSTTIKKVISDFANKHEYPGERTLERYVQAAAGFKEGLSSIVIAKKTQLSVKTIDKIRAWWDQSSTLRDKEHAKEAQGQQSSQMVECVIQDSSLREHLDQITVTAAELASRVHDMLYYRSKGELYYQGNLVDGLHFPDRPLQHPRNTSIKSSLAGCVLNHYEHKFGKSPYNDWREVTMKNASKDVADNLVRLGHSKAFKPCSICPACQEITKPELPDWF